MSSGKYTSMRSFDARLCTFIMLWMVLNLNDLRLIYILLSVKQTWVAYDTVSTSLSLVFLISYENYLKKKIEKKRNKIRWISN